MKIKKTEFLDTTLQTNWCENYENINSFLHLVFNKLMLQ
jgi:hypothetical protein